MDEIKLALKKLYPWASNINYVGRKGRLDVDLEYRNNHTSRTPDVDEVFLVFLLMGMIYTFLSFPILCFIPNPIWANILFVLFSVAISIGTYFADEDGSTCSHIVYIGMNLILTLAVILIAWQVQMSDPKVLRTVPKVFDFLCKFKF